MAGSDCPQHTLILVGGSLLAWHGLREATLDVDSVLRLGAELSAAAALVAGFRQGGRRGSSALKNGCICCRR